ncbi:hypothetical protein PHISCL_09752 [Aspergillus sclerotialis]|uniref:Uncharacterized protein n=1 Tax=Aspergillus sclerotialis TaxID=2070753 RepID=A0A3A2ZL77_9EURO|nr:hypothetical protein PHISCL_09752 [Aspergillus sclerotialis]
MFAQAMLRPLLRTTRPQILPSNIQPRSFTTSTILRDSSSALPAKKPVGAFRGGLFGFLTGTIVAGSAVYYYILSEYRVSNEMLTEDIFALQAATQKLQTYIMELENKVDQLQKKK